MFVDKKLENNIILNIESGFVGSINNSMNR